MLVTVSPCTRSCRSPAVAGRVFNGRQPARSKPNGGGTAVGKIGNHCRGCIAENNNFWHLKKQMLEPSADVSAVEVDMARPTATAKRNFDGAGCCENCANRSRAAIHSTSSHTYAYSAYRGNTDKTGPSQVEQDQPPFEKHAPQQLTTPSSCQQLAQEAKHLRLPFVLQEEVPPSKGTQMEIPSREARPMF